MHPKPWPLNRPETNGPETTASGLSPRRRALRLGAALAWPLALAATPAWLQSGLGPGCLFRALTGWPCPLCGGTHACAALVQGDWVGAWAANPGALGLLALVSLWVLQGVGEAVAGHAQPARWGGAWAVRAVLAGLGLSWVAQLGGWL